MEAIKQRISALKEKGVLVEFAEAGMGGWEVNNGVVTLKISDDDTEETLGVSIDSVEKYLERPKETTAIVSALKDYFS